MYLEKYVGNYVIFKLNKVAREDKTMRLFYNAADHHGFIQNKLVAVDGLGIWVQGFLETEILADENGNKLETPRRYLCSR